MGTQVRVAAFALLVALTAWPTAGPTAQRADIDRDVAVALSKLYESTPEAKEVGEKAKAVLVFPSILKAGLIVGGQGGNGALVKGGVTVGYYNSAAASYGLQVGVQTFGYAMFLMTEEALAYLDKSGGWEVGVGPSVVVVDKESAAAFGKNLSTSTLKDDIYAFVFSQKGLMAGLGLQGSKITRINPE